MMAEQYPPQPGSEPAPQFGPPDAPYADPIAPAAPKKGKTGKIIGIVVGVLVLLLILCGVGAFFLFKNATSPLAEAKVNQCFAGDDIQANPSNPKLKIVECGDGSARYKIVGKIADKTQAEASAANSSELCQPYVDQGVDTSFWQEKSVGAGKGPLFCLAPAK
jgi:hypothetical protein